VRSHSRWSRTQFAGLANDPAYTNALALLRGKHLYYFMRTKQVRSSSQTTHSTDRDGAHYYT